MCNIVLPFNKSCSDYLYLHLSVELLDVGREGPGLSLAGGLSNSSQAFTSHNIIWGSTSPQCNGKSGHPYLLLGLRGKAFHFSLLFRMLTMDFHSLVCNDFVEIFIHNWVLNVVNASSMSTEIAIHFYLVNMVHHID